MSISQYGIRLAIAISLPIKCGNVEIIWGNQTANRPLHIVTLHCTVILCHVTACNKWAGLDRPGNGKSHSRNGALRSKPSVELKKAYISNCYPIPVMFTSLLIPVCIALFCPCSIGCYPFPVSLLSAHWLGFNRCWQKVNRELLKLKFIHYHVLNTRMTIPFKINNLQRLHVRQKGMMWQSMMIKSDSTKLIVDLSPLESITFLFLPLAVWVSGASRVATSTDPANHFPLVNSSFPVWLTVIG